MADASTQLVPTTPATPTSLDALEPPDALDFTERGVTGLRHSGGMIQEELHPMLRGNRAALMYREMAENCPVIGAVLYAMKTWASAVSWEVEAAREGDTEAGRWAWFVESCMLDMSHTWEDFVWEALSMIEYGWSLFEVCYKRRCGPGRNPLRNSAHNDWYVGWRKFAFRAQTTLNKWDIDNDTQSVLGMYQDPPVGTLAGRYTHRRNGMFYLPLDKCLLFRTQVANGNPEGRSSLRNAFVPYYSKRRVQDIELIGIERDIAGMPDMQIPAEFFSATATPAQRATVVRWQKLVSRVKRDQLEGIVRPCELDREGKPTGYKFQLISAGGERSINIDQVVRRHESRVAMSMLAEFVMVGIEKGGGLGGGTLQDSKTDAFALSLSAFPKRIASVINRFAIRPLCLLNGCQERDIPTLKHGDVAAPSLERMAAYVQALSSAGMLMYDHRTERKLREIGDLPQRQETEAGGTGIDSMGDTQAQTPAQEAEAARTASPTDAPAAPPAAA